MVRISLQTRIYKSYELLHSLYIKVKRSTPVKLHGGRTQRVKRCLLPQAKAESLFGKNLLSVAEPKWPEGLLGPSGGSPGVAVFPLLDTGTRTHAHSRLRRLKPVHIRHVHNRPEEFCVYSKNKKWARYVNIGLSDCRRTVAVMDFYKHPFRQGPVLQEPPLYNMQHRHSSARTHWLRKNKGTERVFPYAKIRQVHITWNQYHDKLSQLPLER